MSKILVEKKNDLIKRAEEVLALAKAEQRELTDAEAQELAEIKDDVRRIKETLGLEDDFREMLDAEEKPDAEPRDDQRACGDDPEQRAIDEEKMFEAYLRGPLN